ncbi:hypothetical protein SDC9_85413 [bioreactor metagenome]|uniref:Uncharacterized protein n=1 Tax=bioreactor metagenome TaxID=1076179 RepID=A0A644ZJA3_9ZZZZ
MNHNYLVIVFCVFILFGLCYEIFGKNNRIKKIIVNVVYYIVIIYLFVTFSFFVMNTYF